MNASTIQHQATGPRIRAWSVLILAAALLGFVLSAGLTMLASNSASPASGPADPRLLPPLACGDDKCELGENILCPDDCDNSSGGGGNNGSEEPPDETEPPPDETEPPPDETDPPSNDPVCGNGRCEDRETALNCAVDCVVSVSIEPPTNNCGNGVCDNGETDLTCPKDCLSVVTVVPPVLCGDGICEATESANSCPADCSATGEVCGNGVCESRERENGTCVVDCPVNVVPVCGNLLCELGETFDLCPKDCPYEGPVCGDGVCEDDERDSCKEDCTSSNATSTPTGDGSNARDEEEDGSADAGDDSESGDRDGEAEEEVTETAEAEDEEGDADQATVTPEAAALTDDDDDPGCQLVDYDDLSPEVQVAFNEFDASYDPETGFWLVCERMPPEACLPASEIEAGSIDDLRIINCTANGTCSAHPIRTLEDGEACGRAGRLRRLTCLDGCTLVRGQHPISVTGTVIPLGLVLLVLGSGSGITFLSFARRSRDIEEQFDDIFHLDPDLVTREQTAPADAYEDFYGTLPLDAADNSGE